VSWTISLVGFRLQSATNLAGRVVWSDVTGLPILLQGSNTVTGDFSGQAQFYRLIK